MNLHTHKDKLVERFKNLLKERLEIIKKIWELKTTPYDILVEDGEMSDGLFKNIKRRHMSIFNEEFKAGYIAYR